MKRKKGQFHLNRQFTKWRNIFALTATKSQELWEIYNPLREIIGAERGLDIITVDIRLANSKQDIFAVVQSIVWIANTGECRLLFFFLWGFYWLCRQQV